MTNDRLFIGCYPGGLVYADRHREVNGDYQTVAFLPYSTLELEWRVKKPSTHPLKSEIETDAASMAARRGESFRIAGNMSIILGEK